MPSLTLICLMALALVATPACASMDAAHKEDAAFAYPAPVTASGGGAPSGSPARGAPTPAVSEASAPGGGPAELPPDPRLVIYQGQLVVIVSDVDRARDQLLSLVSESGGHLERRSRDTLVVRIPAPRFSGVVEAARALGRVADESISAQDVTREVFELGLRIDNAERARLRLLDLLERGGELEHVLRLEAELRRVTEEIELLKSKRQRLEGEAAFSTLTVVLQANALTPHPVAVRKVSPFPWVRDIGPENVASMPTEPAVFPALFPNTDLSLPHGFVLLDRGPFELRALDADGGRLWLRSRFVEGGDLAFWKQALTDELEEARGYHLVEVKEHVRGPREKDDQTQEKVLELVVETPVHGRPHRYLLLVVVRSAPLLGTWVATVEHLADKESFDESAARVRAAFLEDSFPTSSQEAVVPVTAGT